MWQISEAQSLGASMWKISMRCAQRWFLKWHSWDWHLDLKPWLNTLLLPELPSLCSARSWSRSTSFLLVFSNAYKILLFLICLSKLLWRKCGMRVPVYIVLSMIRSSLKTHVQLPSWSPHPSANDKWEQNYHWVWLCPKELGPKTWIIFPKLNKV